MARRGTRPVSTRIVFHPPCRKLHPPWRKLHATGRKLHPSWCALHPPCRKLCAQSCAEHPRRRKLHPPWWMLCARRRKLHPSWWMISGATRRFPCALETEPRTGGPWPLPRGEAAKLVGPTSVRCGEWPTYRWHSRAQAGVKAPCHRDRRTAIPAPPTLTLPSHVPHPAIMRDLAQPAGLEA